MSACDLVYYLGQFKEIPLCLSGASQEQNTQNRKGVTGAHGQFMPSRFTLLQLKR